MAKQRVYDEITTCDVEGDDHSTDVETVEVVFKDQGKVLEADLCGKHRSAVTIDDMVTVGRVVRGRKAPGRLPGAAGIPDMFRPE